MEPGLTVPTWHSHVESAKPFLALRGIECKVRGRGSTPVGPGSG